MQGHAFDRARSAGLYDGRMRRLIHAFKYEGKTALVQDFVDLLLEEIGYFLDGAGAACVCHVPLHRSRAARREFNQAALLAVHLAERLRLPHAAHALVRVRNTPSQADLGRAQRRENVRHAFRVGDVGAAGRRSVLLVDDVMTTGATVDECSRTLKKAGITAVHVVTLARSVPHMGGPFLPGHPAETAR